MHQVVSVRKLESEFGIWYIFSLAAMSNQQQVIRDQERKVELAKEEARLAAMDRDQRGVGQVYSVG